MTKIINFRNRIVSTGTADPKTLKSNTLNWRKHPDAQRKAMQDVLGNIGWIQDVIVNKTTGNLIDGHLRVETAIKNNEAEIPVKYVELTDDEEKIALATFDPISAMAEQDDELLKQLLAGVDTEIDLSQYHDYYDKLMRPEHTAEELDAVPDVPKDAKTKRGDVYRLGEHVLMCGDSTSVEDVKRLISTGEGEGQLRVNMIFTDPPWNVAYGSQKNPKLKCRTILNDSMSKQQFASFLNRSFSSAFKFVEEGAMLYVVMSQQECGNIMNELEKLDCHWSSTIIWAKDQFVLSRKDYHTQYEPIYYGWHGEPALKHLDDRKQSDLWNIPRPKRSDEHPTMKPIELCKRAIVNSSNEGDTVLDIFGGSGSTLIACEETGRKCRMMELVPEYCDVIIERWEKLTGKHAEKLP